MALLPFPDLSQPFPRIGIASSSEDEQSSDDDSDKFRIGGRSLAQRRVSRPSPYSETPQEPDEDESASGKNFFSKNLRSHFVRKSLGAT